MISTSSTSIYLAVQSHGIQHWLIDQSANIPAPHKVHVIPQHMRDHVQETEVRQRCGQETGVNWGHHPIVSTVIQVCGSSDTQQIVLGWEGLVILCPITHNSMIESAEEHGTDHLSKVNHLTTGRSCGRMSVDHR